MIFNGTLVEPTVNNTSVVKANVTIISGAFVREYFFNKGLWNRGIVLFLFIKSLCFFASNTAN